MKKIFALAAAALVAFSAAADEGMWLLPLLREMNSKAMKKAGLRLSADEIYSINHSSLKDAIVQFGGGCTGEMISDEGLLVTNHHCGYSTIQRLSTTDHNYLMDGYWALSREKEIPAPGLSVTFLRSMRDVTDVLENTRAVYESKFPEKSDSLMVVFREHLVKEAEEANPHCTAELQGFYNDNVTYLIVYKVYRDVRFVGAPPASMGKFGGETDNWMWPRHTCDFSMFRVYADENNEPAAYSPSNKPFTPERYLKVSTKGVKSGDYAMIMGYPGRTQRFQTASQLSNMIKMQRISIDARTVRQDIMWDAMCADPAVQLKYANKYASSANGWKKWQGEELAFANLDIIGREKAKEEAFMDWVSKDEARQEAYGSALGEIAFAVDASEEAYGAYLLAAESLGSIELGGIVGTYMQRGPEALERTYRDYVPELDRKVAAALIKFYRERALEVDYPKDFGEEFGDFATMDIDKYVDYLFDNSVFTSEEKLKAADPETISSDPAVAMYRAVIDIIVGRAQEFIAGRQAMAAPAKAFTAGLLEWEKGKPSYPDANFTMRLTYGNVLPYSPADGVSYHYFTTLKGVLEKEDPKNPEFIVPSKVKELALAGDYGRWADKDGSLHTCFLTNNDITGGNSGSPVLNAKGELIGLAFDGNWESMSSDVMFEPDLQRCICVDIRYVLWMVEKVGGATNIIDELSFSK